MKQSDQAFKPQSMCKSKSSAQGWTCHMTQTIWIRISFIIINLISSRGSSTSCQVWCSASTSSHGSSWHHYQQAYTSSHEVKANELRLITQALICSERGERVTEPVVNKSSQLLLLIITVITLIIFNSAPWYERVSVYSHLWMPRSPLFNADIQTDTLSSNYELCSGVSVAVGKEKVNSAEKESTICFVLIVLDTCIWPSSSSSSPLPPPLPLPPHPLFLWHCAPPSEPLLLKTDGAPKKQCRVIDTCRNWVTFGPVFVCKLHYRWFIEKW